MQHACLQYTRKYAIVRRESVCCLMIQVESKHILYVKHMYKYRFYIKLNFNSYCGTFQMFKLLLNKEAG